MIGNDGRTKVRKQLGRGISRFVAATVTATSAVAGMSASGADATNATPELIQQLLQRLEKDEAEIRNLKAQLADQLGARGGTNQAPGGLEPRLQQDEAALKSIRSELDSRNASEAQSRYPNLQFHGFGDIDYTADNRKGGQIPYGNTVIGGHNSFVLGEFDLFLSSQLAESVSVLSETVLSADLNSNMGVDIERLELEDRFNEHFILDAGRFHTALGYYNSTYHHGTWLETAVGRPSFLEFEDSGGILPVHMVGLSLHGSIPSGAANLSYYVEVGNGLHYSSNPTVDRVQQVASFGDSKAINLALYARPDGVPGLQAGAGLYFDEITPDLSTPVAGGPSSLPRNRQFIYNGSLSYHRAEWALMVEGYLIQDTPNGGNTHYDPAFFVEASRKIGVLTPYARFTYYHVTPNDLLYRYAWAGGVNVGVHYGPSIGLRYDFSNFAAFKAQYDYLHDSGYNDATRVTLQAAFTF
jgi:hypothetical protein